MLWMRSKQSRAWLLGGQPVEFEALSQQPAGWGLGLALCCRLCCQGRKLETGLPTHLASLCP